MGSVADGGGRAAASPGGVARALISVSDKRGIVEFGRALAALGIEILGSGGTARTLQDSGVAVTDIAAYTGFPEIMGGRVKTLHPAIHGGILARRGVDEEAMAAHGIAAIDLVVVNLYPFAEATAQPDCTPQRAVEHIDIGGVALVRAAAKNHAAVTVVVCPEDYAMVLRGLEGEGRCVPATLRRRLAVRAFAHTAGYDSAIARYLETAAAGDSAAADNGGADQEAADAPSLPSTLHVKLHKQRTLRYGENPHQTAALYATDPAAAHPWRDAALSYNNIADADAAYQCVRGFDRPACVIVKHANPCGVAAGDSQADAYQSAYATDPESAYGGIIAFNTALDEAAACAVAARFAEVVIAPQVTPAAAKALAARPAMRVIAAAQPAPHRVDFKVVSGGVLVQAADHAVPVSMEVVTERAPDAAEWDDLRFAWSVAKFVKSNAVVYAAHQRTMGIGAGQMSRVNSARIAAARAQQAGLSLTGAVMASDGFLPFRDSLEQAAAAGIRAIIQPGGAKRDAEVIAAADALGLAMVFTGMRHFRH